MKETINIQNRKNEKGGWTISLRERLSAGICLPLPGSMTVEATLLLPIFIYFFVNILTLFDILRVQADVDAALHQAGSRLCVDAFDISFAADTAGRAGGNGGSFTGANGGAVQNAITAGRAGSMVKAYLNENGGRMNCVVGGAGGIRYMHSGFFENGDIIDIVADYDVQPLLKIYGFDSFNLESRFYGHAWTGYDISDTSFTQEDEEEEYVYVTETGTVFHRSMSCTHLDLSIQPAHTSQLIAMRNESGGIYHHCERCATGHESGGVYITNYGDRYHTSTQCSGLKRTIYTVPVSEAMHLPPCRKCGSR